VELGQVKKGRVEPGGWPKARHRGVRGPRGSAKSGPRCAAVSTMGFVTPRLSAPVHSLWVWGVEASVLHRVVRGNLATLLRECAEAGGLSRFVEKDFGRWKRSRKFERPFRVEALRGPGGGRVEGADGGVPEG